MDLIGWMLVAVGVIIVVLIVWLYNSIISKKIRVSNAWSQIDVQLKKRSDLVPNLVEMVKGYAKHERAVFENVTRARSAMLSAKTPAGHAKASDALTRALKTLFAVAENYPQLRASENFKLLQEQLDGIESKIAYARQFYNDSVMDYNTAIQTFPGNIFAGIFGFTQKEFFEVAEAEKKPVKIKFE